MHAVLENKQQQQQQRTHELICAEQSQCDHRSTTRDAPHQSSPQNVGNATDHARKLGPQQRNCIEQASWPRGRHDFEHRNGNSATSLKWSHLGCCQRCEEESQSRVGLPGRDTNSETENKPKSKQHHQDGSLPDKSALARQICLSHSENTTMCVFYLDKKVSGHS